MSNGHLCSFSHNMHVKQYDYILKLSIITQKFKIKNLKISITVNLSPMSQERVFQMGYPLFLCLGMPLCLGLICLVELWILVVLPWVR